MKIGEVLTYNGRAHVLLGTDPMGVPDPNAELRDTETGEVIAVPFSLLAQSSKGFAEEA